MLSGGYGLQTQTMKPKTAALFCPTDGGVRGLTPADPVPPSGGQNTLPKHRPKKTTLRHVCHVERWQ